MWVRCTDTFRVSLVCRTRYITGDDDCEQIMYGPRHGNNLGSGLSVSGYDWYMSTCSPGLNTEYGFNFILR